MNPVKIKYWGLFWFSKRDYLLFNGIGWFVATGLAVAVVYLNFLPPLPTLWRPDPAWGIRNYFWWLYLICLAGQLIDAAVFWRKCAQKEEDERRLQEDETRFEDEGGSGPDKRRSSDAIRGER